MNRNLTVLIVGKVSPNRRYYKLHKKNNKYSFKNGNVPLPVMYLKNIRYSYQRVDDLIIAEAVNLID